MNRLTVIAVTSALALFLVACGDKGSSKPADESTTTEQTEGNKEAAPAQNTEAAPATQNAAPAEAQPAEGEKH